MKLKACIWLVYYFDGRLSLFSGICIWFKHLKCFLGVDGVLRQNLHCYATVSTQHNMLYACACASYPRLYRLHWQIPEFGVSSIHIKQQGQGPIPEESHILAFWKDSLWNWSGPSEELTAQHRDLGSRRITEPCITLQNLWISLFLLLV